MEVDHGTLKGYFPVTTGGTGVVFHLHVSSKESIVFVTLLCLVA